MAEEATYGYSTTEPAAERVVTARALLEQHRRVYVPEPVCNWCLTRYPCSHAGWSMRVLRRAEIGQAGA
jgi:hypothetical protein